MSDRARGTLIGLAVGDALGAAVEFQPPGSFRPVTGYRDGGPHGLAAGEWTDDTSMALALADSIAAAGWDLNDQTDRYTKWWKSGKYSVNGRCFDIGITTRTALGRYLAGGDARSSGDRSEQASGNGSIMRLAPVPICFSHLYAGKLDELSRLAAESSLPTHASDQCVSACRYLALVLAALIHGEERGEVLSPDWGPLQQMIESQPLHPKIHEVAAGSFRHKQPPAVKGSGWVVQSLEASLWAFHDADSFEEAVLRAVNLGDDADTTGAVTGQLAGAYWGESGIPQKWLEGLAQRDMIEEALAGLLSKSAKSPPDRLEGGPTTQSVPKQSRATINVETLPQRPSFLTANAGHRAENEALVEQALELAACGNVAGLRSLQLTPSPKLRTWHAELVSEVDRQLSAVPRIKSPTASSYWVVPGRFLAGAYPGAPDPQDHQRRVSDLLAAGVRVFVNLMEADESDHKGASFVPYEDIVRKLQPGASCLRFPIQDLSVPTIDEMTGILDAIDGCLAENQAVYVHCWGGVGRTGTVVACWTLRHGLASPDNVLHQLSHLRRQDRERGSRESPETFAQRQFVLGWPESAATAQPARTSPCTAAPAAGGPYGDFKPTLAADRVFRELLDRYPHMEGFTEGPFGMNRLTTTESVLFGAAYELRRLLGSVDSPEESERLAKLWDLLVDGVLRSMVLARGGNDWVEDD